MTGSDTFIPGCALYGELESDTALARLRVGTISAHRDLHNCAMQEPAARGWLRLVLVLGGEVTACFGAAPLVCPAPALVVVPPDTQHRLAFSADASGSALCVPAWAVDALLDGLGDEGLRPALARAAVYPLAGATLAAHGLPAHFAAITEESVWTAPARDAASSAYLGLILAGVARLHAARERAGPAHGHDDALFLRFRQLIEAHYRSQAGVAFYATRLGLTRSRLTALCRRVTGQPPLAVIHARLIAEAKHRLRFSAASVAAIGEALGFRDPAYFSRFFARATGAAPARWRRLHATRD